MQFVNYALQSRQNSAENFPSREKGVSVIGQSQTGSGKTHAYLRLH